jgi:hypothetical protein
MAFDRLIVAGKQRPANSANSGNRGSYFGGEPALAAGLIQGSHNVEVSAATDHQAIFIWWAWDSGGDFHELAAGGRAPIHVVDDKRQAINEK